MSNNNLIIEIDGKEKRVNPMLQRVITEPVPLNSGDYNSIAVKFDYFGNPEILNGCDIDKNILKLSEENKLKVAEFMTQRWSEYANKLKGE